jgi:hypothetical protein
MGVVFPNRVGEFGAYSTAGLGSVTVSGALPGMRTFDNVVEGDTIGVSIQAVEDQDVWAVWTATVTHSFPATVNALAVEDSSGTLVEGTPVKAVCCVTAATLNLAYLPATLLDTTGPNYWVVPNANFTESNGGIDAYYDIYSYDFVATPTGSWEVGFRPTSVSLEVFIPSYAGADTALISIEVDDASVTATGDPIGAGFNDDSWVILSCDLTALTSDITELRVAGIASVSNGEQRFYVRRIVFTS